MNVRLILAVFLAIGGMGVLLAHPAFYSRSWAFGLLVVFVGCGVVAAFWCAVHRDWPLSGAVSVALAVVGMSTLLSIAVNEGTNWSGLWLPVTHWLLVCLGAWLATDGAALRLLAAALVAGAAVAGFYAVLQYYQLDPLPTVTPFGSGRIVSVFENPNFLGNFSACALPLALMAFLRAESLVVRILLAIGTCAIYAGVLLAGSRGGWMAGLAAVLVVIIGVARGVWQGRIRLVWSSLVVLSVLLIATTLALSQRPVVKTREHLVTMSERMLSTRHIIEPYVESGAPIGTSADGEVEAPTASRIEVRDFTVNHRYFIWEVTWDMISAQPLLGLGYGTYQERFATFRDARREEAHFKSLIWTQQEEDTPYAHNEYLHLWAESGLVGLLAFLALITLAGSKALHIAWRDTLPYLWAGLGIIVAMLVHSLVSYPLRLPLNGFVFWLMVGILAGFVKKVEN